MKAGVDEGTWLSEERLRSRRPWYGVNILLVPGSLVFHQPLLFVAELLACTVAALPEVWYHFYLAGLVYQRQLGERRVFFGETITFRLVVENRKLLSLPWLEVEDEFPEVLGLHGGRLEPHHKPRRMRLITALSLWWFQRAARRYRVRCSAHGVFSFGPVILRSGDLFDILTREQQVEHLDTILVYPPLLPIERFGLPSRHPFGEHAAPRRLLEDPLRVAGIRDGAPGDELHRVHWKATARDDAAKQGLRTDTTGTLALFLNVNSYPNPVPGTNPALLELVIAAAASVGARATEQGYAVGLYLEHVKMLTEDTERLLRRLAGRSSSLPPGRKET